MWKDQFKYLGAQFTATGDLNAELSHRIGIAAAVFRRLLRPFFCQVAIDLGTKMIVLFVLVLSVMLYGCESWALSAAQLQRLEVVYRGWLRQVLGVSRQDVSNEELLARCRPAESIETHWARRMLNYLGHVGRMSDDRLAKQLMWGRLSEGTGRPGRKSNALLTDVYSARLMAIQPLLLKARREYQAKARAEGSNTHNFSWLVACADRTAWRRMIGYRDTRPESQD